MNESPMAADAERRPRAVDPLLTSCWQAHLAYEFDAGTEIHPGVFDVVAEVLGEEPHFCHEVGSTLHVAVTVIDGSSSAKARLRTQARAIADELPNARLGACDLGENPDPFGHTRPDLRLLGE